MIHSAVDSIYRLQLTIFATRMLSNLPQGSKIGFIGAGKIAQALIKGFLNAKLAKPENIIASDVDKEMLNKIQELGIENYYDNNKMIIQNCDFCILAVKPQILRQVLLDIEPALAKTPGKLLISIAAGMSTDCMNKVVPSHTRIIRVMPNTPALVLQGATAFTRGTNATDQDAKIVELLFNAIGITIEVKESLMDAVTGLSGSGPAYVSVFLEALADGGVKMGLPRHIAMKLATQTILGTAYMIQKTNIHPAELKDLVCSPGGTCIAAVYCLESNNFRSAIISAVETATKRSQELNE